MRLAGYAQDEWSLSEHWAAHAGLRWEGIRTRGSVEEGQPEAVNQSSVWTPLLHAVWKPDPKGRDQVRFSLTRSYRSPTLSNLIARPSVNTRYPVPGPNTPTQADRAGNPNLKPELATGIDIAVERYLRGQRPAERQRLPAQHQQLHAQRDDARDGLVRRACRATCRARRTSATR